MKEEILEQAEAFGCRCLDWGIVKEKKGIGKVWKIWDCWRVTFTYPGSVQWSAQTVVVRCCTRIFPYYGYTCMSQFTINSLVTYIPYLHNSYVSRVHFCVSTELRFLQRCPRGVLLEMTKLWQLKQFGGWWVGWIMLLATIQSWPKNIVLECIDLPHEGWWDGVRKGTRRLLGIMLDTPNIILKIVWVAYCKYTINKSLMDL